VPLEIFRGPDVSALLAQARAALGPDSVIVSVRRARRPQLGFELEVADAVAARELKPAPTRHAGRAPGPAPVPAEGRPFVMALVGPTGAGKTTTIAKLANHPSAFGSRSVGLLCLDTYRIGGVEQLRIYAEVSALPFAVAYDSREVDRARQRLRHCDVILVDTAGRGPRAEQDRAASHSQLLQIGPDEVHLVLPAGLCPSLARRVVAQHRTHGVTHLLPTKLDEFAEDTTAFDLAAEFGLPVRWYTDGQEVPRDLHSAAGHRARSGAFAETRELLAAEA
jgi:flagellar biosynthesis protein FlhF